VLLLQQHVLDTGAAAPAAHGPVQPDYRSSGVVVKHWHLLQLSMSITITCFSNTRRS
jgi:hypothetical protein